MTGKVHHVDWRAVDWLEGTRGLGFDQTAVYITVVNVIYARGGRCPNDPKWIGGQIAKPHERKQSVSAATARVGRAIAELVGLGKLHLSPDDKWLTNGRADVELGRAGERIVGAYRAGVASGAARRARKPSTSHQPPINTPRGAGLSHINDLARTTVRNHQPPYESDSKISTDAARDPSPDRKAPGRAPGKPDQRLTDLASKARKRFMGDT